MSGALPGFWSVIEYMRSPLSESKATMGEERIRIHSGCFQLEMALALHVEDAWYTGLLR